MPYSVSLTADAARDLSDLYSFIDGNDVPGKADYVLGKIEQVLTSLNESPSRGSYPRELADLGVTEYREVFFKPYRIIYRIIDEGVFILMIVDGRRDLEPLLQRRLFFS